MNVLTSTKINLTKSFSKLIKSICLVFLLVNVFSNLSVKSFYFGLHLRERKCFEDEFYNEIIIILRYEVLNNFSFYQENNTSKLLIEVINNDNQEIIEQFKGIKLNEKFSIHLFGNNQIKFCVSTDYKPWFEGSADPLFLRLKIDTNEDDVGQENSLKNKDIANLEKNLGVMLKKANEVSKMQEHGTIKEEKFSQSQVENSNQIIVLTIVETIIVVVVGVLQICWLKKRYNDANVK
jgi:hypothetical protein